MIKIFKIFENSLYSSLKSFDFDDINENNFDKLRKIIDFGDVHYKIEIPYYSNIDFSIHMKERDLLDMISEYYLEDWIFRWCLQFCGYNDYYYEVDSDELNYIGRYLSQENIQTIKKLANLLDIKIDVNEDYEINYLFQALGNNFIKEDSLLYELSLEYTNAIESNVKEALKDLPFTFSHSNNSNFDLELEFNMDQIDNYIEEYKLKNINTIKDLISNTDFSEFDFSKLENPWESNYERNYEGLQQEIQNQLNKILEELEGDIEPEYMDPNQLSLFQDFDDKLIKKVTKHTPKKYNFQHKFYSKLDVKNVEYAKKVGGKILAWFKSYEFQKDYMRGEQLNDFNFLKRKNIIHPAIEYEYGYLETSSKYNL